MEEKSNFAPIIKSYLNEFKVTETKEQRTKLFVDLFLELLKVTPNPNDGDYRLLTDSFLKLTTFKHYPEFKTIHLEFRLLFEKYYPDKIVYKYKFTSRLREYLTFMEHNSFQITNLLEELIFFLGTNDNFRKTIIRETMISVRKLTTIEIKHKNNFMKQFCGKTFCYAHDSKRRPCKRLISNNHHYCSRHIIPYIKLKDILQKVADKDVNSQIIQYIL
jgi:hypothetical protein